jgi:hypothetical protein
MRGDTVTWERRLRDLLLAGGTLAVMACSSGGTAPARSDPPLGNGADDNEIPPSGLIYCSIAERYWDACRCGLSEACPQQEACEERGGPFARFAFTGTDGGICTLADGGTLLLTVDAGDDGDAGENRDAGDHDAAHR